MRSLSIPIALLVLAIGTAACKGSSSPTEPPPVTNTMTLISANPASGASLTVGEPVTFVVTYTATGPVSFGAALGATGSSSASTAFAAGTGTATFTCTSNAVGQSSGAKLIMYSVSPRTELANLMIPSAYTWLAP